MNRVADYLFAIVLTLWVGGLWAIGMIAAPTLFHLVSDTRLAGTLAGGMFAITAWVGIVAGAYALIYLLAREGAGAAKTSAFWIVFLMLALTLAGYFGITPILERLRAAALPREVMESVMRDRFVTWHGISNVLYLIQCILGITLVSQLFSRR